jgi:hypothetical protein
MVDRVVVLHADDGLSFIADACAVMADAVNDPVAGTLDLGRQRRSTARRRCPVGVGPV